MKNLVSLSNATFSDIPDGIARPSYDRSAITPGIVHIGLGNFHRAHQAWYTHRLMQTGEAMCWGILGAGVRSGDAVMRDKLLTQDCLTTLIELNPDQMSAEVTGAMIDFLPVHPENADLIAAMAQPEIRIVALTVTEGGYYIDPVTKGLNVTHPDILNDLANPDRPMTAFGAIVAALKIRKAQDRGGFTGLSCDNVQGNGTILKTVVVSLAELSDPDLAAWIETQCSFPNSMVDCIVPATGPNEIALVETIGIKDVAPVTHENYRQWVIEDKFCAGRPDWDRVGATFTDDVHSYETMKIRLLNGSHQILANTGELLSVETIAACMEHKLVSGLFRKIALEEIAPHVVPVPGMTPQDYVPLIARRFANPRIHDTTRRVAFDGSSRHVGFLIPTLREALEAGTAIEGLALAEALWARMCLGLREDGSEIKANDPIWAELQLVASAAKESPRVWLEQKQIYGDLSLDEAFVTCFESWLALIFEQGVEAAIKMYLKDG